MLYETLKEKYQATDYSSEVAHNPLSYILRKAEIGSNLNSIEWEWLEQQQLHKVIENIQQQESYRAELRRSITSEPSEIGYRDFITSFTVPDIDSCLLFVLYKISAQELLTVNDFNEASKEKGDLTNLNAYNDYILLKNKHEIIEKLPFSADALKILTKIDIEKKLSFLNIEWLIERNVYSVFAALQSEISRLQDKYHALGQFDVATLYLILQKLEENRSLTNQDIAFLKSKQLNKTLEIAQKLEFAWLKKFYKATQIEDSSPEHHLYKVLKKLRDGLPLNEPDINYLKKRQLVETIEIAFKPQIQILENKIRSNKELSSEDKAWCEKFQFNDLLFMALKTKYGVLNDYSNQSVSGPLYSILQKLEQGERLSDVNIVWLQGEDFFKPKNKIFITHFELEAVFAEQEYQRTRNKWFIVNASSYWRKADEPEKALHLTEQIDFKKIKEAKLKQALLTTRGGALRDLGNLTDAEKCALQAIEYWSKSHNPYTLLGAICYGTRRHVEGDRWFDEAIKRGATERDVDAEIKRVLQKIKDKNELQALIDYLLNKDSHRYDWVKKYRKLA